MTTRLAAALTALLLVAAPQSASAGRYDVAATLYEAGQPWSDFMAISDRGEPVTFTDGGTPTQPRRTVSICPKHPRSGQVYVRVLQHGHAPLKRVLRLREGRGLLRAVLDRRTTLTVLVIRRD